MGDNDPQSLPIFPSIIFIIAPVLGITGLLCWATIQNRRRFRTRQLRQRDVANLPSEEDEPGLYEIWVDSNLNIANEHLVGQDHLMHSDTNGELGDHRSLCMVINCSLRVKIRSLNFPLFSSYNAHWH